MLKRFLSFAMAIALFATAIYIKPLNVQAEDTTDETLTPVYYMDFSPVNGVFYDSPANVADKQEVARIANPTDMVMLPSDGGNVDDKIINTQAGGNESGLYASQNSKELYAAFSKGTTAGDFNTGASGALDDYCLKTVDTSVSNSSTCAMTLELPNVYGSTTDSTQKYRIETDWKWQSYSSTTALAQAGNPSGASILGFVIGEKTMYLKTQASRNDEYRGTGAFFFYDGDNSSSSTFGLTPSSQATKEADLDKITKSAAPFDADQSGKWIHITVDIDFANGTIYAALQGDGVTREISTAISKGQDTFKSGISAIRTFGSTKPERRINFFDNVKISAAVQPSDEEILEDASTPAYTFDDIKGNNTDILNVEDDLVLPTQRNGVSVSWSVSPSSASKYINLATGKITAPTPADGDRTIALTPIYSRNSATLVGSTISGIVLKATEGEYPLDAVYYMDFSPRSDGEFYDYPENISGGTQVKRLAVTSDTAIFSDHTIADNMCIALDADDNKSKIQPATRTLNDYAAFSKGSASGDVNTGASGDADDYCLKIIDASTDSAPSVNITFPQSYGNPECSGDYVKYRFEMDYKWQHYSDMATTSTARPTGTSWLRFYFGENYINLYSKSGSEHETAPDANGASALCFTSTAFGMETTTNQLVPVGQTGNVTAPMFSGSASGNWVHITVDFDFEEGTIKAVIEGNGNEDRIIETSIPDGTGAGGESFKTLFMEGLTGVSIRGATGGNLRVIWADNIKISPIKTVKMTPSEKLYEANNPPTTFEDIKGINSDASNVCENLNLISQKGDVAVTWAVTPASSSRYVNVTSGLVTRPTFTEGSKSLTLTPIYTVAGRSLEGDAIDVIIGAQSESALERIERIITDSPFVFDDIKGANTVSTAVVSDLTIPSSADGDIAVSWSVQSADMANYVDVSTGKVTRPEYTGSDTKIRLIPTYSLGEVEMAGQAIEFTIAKNTLDISGADVQDAYAITEADLTGSGQSLGNVTGSLTLPKTGKLYGSTIVWSANSLIVDTSTGAIKRPFGASKVNVVLTATVTNGGSSTTRQFNVTITDTTYGSGNSYSGGGGGGFSGGSSGGGVVHTGSASVSVAPPSVTPDTSVFNDIESVTWAKAYIEKLHKLGVVQGDGSGAFYPERDVTREEFVKMLLLTFDADIDKESKSTFDDVDDGAWFESYVSTAHKLGIVNGISANEFGTGHCITRQDMAVMIVRCLEYKGIDLNSAENQVQFADAVEISGYAREAVDSLRISGILNGDSNLRFNPKSFAKRAEVAKVLGMLLEYGQA